MRYWYFREPFSPVLGTKQTSAEEVMVSVTYCLACTTVKGSRKGMRGAGRDGQSQTVLHGRLRSPDLTVTFSSPSLPFSGTQKELEDAPKHMTYLMNTVKMWRSDNLPPMLVGTAGLLRVYPSNCVVIF